MQPIASILLRALLGAHSFLSISVEDALSMKLTVDAADSKGIVCSYSREDASTTLQPTLY
jgi:hypothetical protein